MANIERSINNIENQLKRFEEEPDDHLKEELLFVIQNSQQLSYAESLITNTRIDLSKVKSELGINNKEYINLSSKIAYIVCEFVNMYIPKIKVKIPLKKSTNEYNKLLQDVMKCVELLSIVKNFDVEEDIKQKINETLIEVNKIEKALKPISGCFIATNVYGDYNSIEVLKLRLFRDKYLMNNLLGKEFVNVYYKFSPILVNKMNDKNVVSKLIKFKLDIFIKVFLK